MSNHLDTLRGDYEKAEEKLQKLGAEYDDAKAKLKDRYANRLAKASEAAAAAQKAYCDAMAAEALLDRPGGEAIAQALGLQLPDSD